jgi:opacity protein-like surface antigen
MGSRSAPRTLARGRGYRQAFVLLTAAFSATVEAEGDGIYAGVGLSSVQGYAHASGSFLESASKYSVAGRLELGYGLTLSPLWGLRGEVYVLPQKIPLGLGDEAKNTWGFAGMPTFALRPDTKVFVGLGYEQTQTNSPVSDWSRFRVDTPVLTAGASYSLESLLKFPVSVSARYEYAQYQKIDFEGQFDRIRQGRLTFTADYRF